MAGVAFCCTIEAQTEYYFRNVETGLWLGPGNNWGTRASVLQHPYWNRLLDTQNNNAYVTATTLPTGKYRLESQVDNGSSQYYMGGNDDAPYLDNGTPWTLNITRTAEGLYTIQKEGGSYYGASSEGGLIIPLGSESKFKWRIRSYYDMMNTMKDATTSAPVDVTFLMLDPDFSHNNKDQENAWTLEASNTNFVTISGGNVTNKCTEAWHTTFNLSQTLNGVPNGTYQLTAQGFYRNDGASATVTFPFSTGGENQTATYSTGSEGWFSSNGVDHGTHLTPLNDPQSGQTLFQPSVKEYDSNNDNIIYFWFTPANGQTFRPSKVSFNTTRWGTDGGTIDVSWVNSDGTTIPIESGIVPARNNATPNVTEFSADVTGAAASNGKCGLRINLYNLNTDKQVGFSDIVIEGLMYLNGVPSFYINGQTQAFPQRTGSENSMSDASASFSAGRYTINPIQVTVYNNTITLGASLADNRNLWCVLDNFVLTYLGNDGSQDFGTVSFPNDVAVENANESKFFVEYMGQDAGEERWLGSASSYGARATLLKHPQYVLLTKTADGYTIKSQLTGDNLLGANASGDILDPYMDRPSGITFQLEGVTGEIYNISSDGVYYSRSTNRDENGYYTLVGNRGGFWQIFSRDEMLRNMMKQGTEDNPSDATWLIRDHNFGRNNRDVNSWTMVASNQNLSGGENTQTQGSIGNNCAESYHSDFSLSQIINVPNGIYELTIQGFYRQDGSDNTHLPYFYINEKTTPFLLRTGSENSMTDAAQSFSSGEYTTGRIRVYVSDGTITLGAKLEGNTSLWCVWDNFELYYLGNPSEKLEENKYYIRNVATGKWLGPANTRGFEASLIDHAQYMVLHPQADGTYLIKSQIRNYGSNYYLGELDTPDGLMYLAVNTNRYYLDILPTPNGHYTISVNGQYLGYDGSTTVVTRNASGINAEWEILTHDQMIEEMLQGTAASPTDATFLIKDPNFDYMHSFYDSWVGTDGETGYKKGGNQSNQCIEKFHTVFRVSQVLQNVPNGTYRLTAQGFYRVDGDDYYNIPRFFLNGTTVDFHLIAGSENSMANASTSFSAGKYKVTTANVTVTNGRIELGAELVDNATLWSIWDNFELEYLGPVEGTPYYHADTSTSSLWVVPKQSFLADRADALHAVGIDFPTGFLQAGLGWKASEYGRQVTDAVASAAGIAPENYAKIQNGSVYTTIHYVKQGEWSPVFLTTNNGQTQSHHDLYQRWYYFDDTTPTALEKPLGGDMMAPQNWAYQYANGLVMGTQLKNGADKSIDLNGGTQPITMAVQLKLPTGKTELIVGGDITRYSDLSYSNTSANTAVAAGNLTETTLSLRHIYKLRDAKLMAAALTAKTGDNYLEEYTIHFPSKTIGVRDDHVPLNLELRDYWFFRSGNASSNSNDDLQNISGDEFLRIEVNYPDGTDLGFGNFGMIVAPSTDRGGNDLTNLYPISNTTMLRRRLVNFSYPAGGEVAGGSRMILLVKAHNPERNEDYNIARFTIIFDSDSETLPYMDIVGEDAAMNNRSSQNLRALVEGEPVAHIDFDFPHNKLFQAPNGLAWFHGIKDIPTDIVGQSGSALPFLFENSNYSFSTMSPNDMWMPQWGDYTIGFETQNPEPGCGTLHAYPVSKYTNDQLDGSLQSGFLFVDASDLPGTVATIPFTGNFCLGSRMLCTGWMTSRIDQMPGSVILNVMGITDSGTEELVYAFCPGQVGLNYRRYGETALTKPAENADYVWQQFYFDFTLDKRYSNYVLRVENNCESTNGGDYMLDDIWVWVQVPTLNVQRSTPLCGGGLDVVELEVDFSTLLSKTGLEETNDPSTAISRYMTCIYLDWDKFLADFKAGLVTMNKTFNIGDHTGVAAADLNADQLAELFHNGVFEVAEYDALNKQCFLANLLRFQDNSIAFSNFQWSNCFSSHAEYVSLASLTTNPNLVYRDGEGDERRLLFNGSFIKEGVSTSEKIESFDYYHNYALLTMIGGTTGMDVASILDSGNDSEINALIENFDVRSSCTSRSPLYFKPKTEILGTMGATSLDEIEICSNTDITFAMELTGIAKAGNTEAEEGEEVVIKNAYFDWWLGKPGTIATVENYYYENNGNGIDLYTALRRFRLVYPTATSLFSSDIVAATNPNYENEPFTQEMLDYLRSLAKPADGSNPQLIIHQKVVEIHASDDMLQTIDGKTYINFVAVPIEENVNQAVSNYVYACSEPLPFRVLVREHAPAVREGFSNKHYPSQLGTLSVRIAKSQFEKVRDHGDGLYKLLHIPLRNVQVYTDEAIGVRKIDNSAASLVRLANTSDGVMQDYIVRNTRNLLPPAVGTVDYFYALRDEKYTGNDQTYNNRLAKLHFSPDFQVREGYSYTLRMYFEEAFSATTQSLPVPDWYVPEQSGESTINLNEGAISLTFGNDGKWSNKQHALDDNLNYYVIGGNNPKDNEGVGYTVANKRLPTNGTYYKFRSTDKGIVKFGIVLNAGKPLYVTDDLGNPLNDNEKFIVTDASGMVKYLDLSNKLSDKLNGFVQFPVDANKTYYLFSTGSKLGFYGFYFNSDGFPVTCEGTMDVILKIVPDYEVWTGKAGTTAAPNTDWNNDENWRRADYDELQAANGSSLRDTYKVNGEVGYNGNLDNVNYVTDADRDRQQGFAPLYCTSILMMQSEEAEAPMLYNDGEEMETVSDGQGGTTQQPTGFPSLRNTSSPLIRYDFQCHEWNSDLATLYPDKSAAEGDMVTELYTSNVCDKIAFQPKTELVAAHLLDYKKAWVEYELSKNQWHLVGSPLQDMLSAEWYAPTGTARQNTTYYESVQFDDDNTFAAKSLADGDYTFPATTISYDRFAPAVYQRSWDKAKAVVYERGAIWSATDGSQTENLGSDTEGQWVQQGTGDDRYYEWSTDGMNADEYLHRLTYKPMGNSKANVAVKGTWSGVYNDHTVPYSCGGFSVMPINSFKNPADDSNVKTLFRMPKEDTFYDIWDWGKSYAVDARVRVNIKEGVAEEGDASNTVYVPNRGKLHSDIFADASTTKEKIRGVEQPVYNVTLRNEGNGSLGYFLASNPFICGLDMEKFFETNAAVIESYYLTLKNEDFVENDDQLTHYSGTWTWTDMGFRGLQDGSTYYGEAVVPARYAFFLKAKNTTASSITLKFTPDMMTVGREVAAASPSRPGQNDTMQSQFVAFTIRAERNGLSSEAMVELSDKANNTFCPEEDMETFVVDGITNNIPVVYTLCGRLATSINRIHDFKVLPIGVESASNAPCTLTFKGVEQLGDSVGFYDAVTQELTPLKSGMKFTVSGQTQNRYYLVSSLNEEKVAEETHLQIFTEGLTAKVIASTAEPITSVRCFDMSGRLIHTATPQTSEYSFSLPKADIYIIEAQTEKDRKTKKVMAK